MAEATRWLYNGESVGGVHLLAERGGLMAAFEHHIFVCCNRRDAGNPRGCCNPDGSDALRERFKHELQVRGMGPLVRANKSGCLEQCEHGPTVVIYPQGIWYGGVNLEDVPRIVEHTVLEGAVLEDLRIADSCLNNKDCPHINGRKAVHPA